MRLKYAPTWLHHPHTRLLFAVCGRGRAHHHFFTLFQAFKHLGLHAVIQPPFGETAPAMICVLTRKVIAYRDRTFYVQDYAAAIENMLLAVVALGYESCWVEGHITDLDNIGRRMADVLGVPKEYDLVCFLPVGVAESTPRKTAKKPFEERAWFNGFPQNK